MYRFHPTPALAMLAALTLALAACSSTQQESAAASASASASAAGSSAAASAAESAEPAEPAGPEEVRIVASEYTPDELTVATGTEVVFVNDDSFAHTVTEGTDGQAADDAFVDEEVAGSGEVRVTFDEAGTFDITCRFHPEMQMTVTVEG